MFQDAIDQMETESFIDELREDNARMKTTIEFLELKITDFKDQLKGTGALTENKLVTRDIEMVLRDIETTLKALEGVSC